MVKNVLYHSCHTPETSAINQHHFAGVRFIWYQIPAPMRKLFYSKPESDVHVAEMIIYDLFRFNFPLATISAIIIAAASVPENTVDL